MIARLLDGLFPRFCPLCQGEPIGETLLCHACRTSLPKLPEGVCRRCGMLFPGELPEGCAICRRESRVGEGFFCPFVFQEPVDQLVTGLKFGDRTEWAALMGELWWQECGEALSRQAPDMVVPIPLHPWRLIRRRYNQSALLAREVARRLGVPLHSKALLRLRWTLPQTRLSRAERVKNLMGAFWARPAVVKGRTVVVLDDVMTTGATLQNAVATLYRAGASRVMIACFARTL
ncbi:MAG: ComF family protein [Magnetococcales bacterium]|nr:ComF family protein [Magnetococcales bacterium]